MEEANFIFSSESLELKSEGNDFFVEGYISTSDLDLVNDIVTKACLLDMAEQMKKRTIKFDVEHESFRGKSNLDREVNKTIIPVAKVDDFLMDKKGLRVRAKLNSHSRRFDEVKGSIQDGFLDAFSIAYVPVKTVVQEKNGQQVRLLDKINLLNVAFTGNPVNTEARMVNVFTKSLEFLKDKESPNHSQSNDIIKLQEVKQMSEEENKETTEIPEESAPVEEAESTELESTEETKDEETQPKESDEDKEEKEDTEVKSLRAEVKALTEKVNVMEKALKKPLRKSKVEQQDKSENFKEEKAQNPLDMIA